MVISNWLLDGHFNNSIRSVCNLIYSLLGAHTLYLCAGSKEMVAMSDRTYISIYELPDCKGKVLARSYLNLHWSHDKVWKKAKKLALEYSGKSFGLLEFKTGRNIGETDL